jgi:hypothetical protein
VPSFGSPLQYASLCEAIALMDLQACWTSLSCLERWEPYFKWTPAFAAAFVILGVVASQFVGRQITYLKAPRSLSSEQVDIISIGLKDKPKAIFQVTTLSTMGDEPVQFGGQLQKLLTNVGWQSKGLTLYYMDGGDSPPIGVNVIVDGHDFEASKSGASLAEIFRMAGIQGVQFYSTRQQRGITLT